MTKTAVRQPVAQGLLWLSVILGLFALALLWHYARKPYLLDIIGRTLRIDAITLSQRLPIYSAPALSMPYTPGFVLLNSVLIKLYGFGYQAWNAVWALSGVLFLFCFTTYFWRADKVFAPFISAGLLACLFPFIWARGDIYAIALTGTGMLLLGPLAGRSQAWKTVLAVLLFALALFFKQTMLPAIVAVIWLANEDKLFKPPSLVRSFFLLSAVVVLFGLMMLAYMVAWRENLVDVLAVLTVGKGHAIHWRNILFYSGMYLLMLAPPMVYIWRNAGWARDRMLVLLVLGAPYILFSAKDGGGWHHFLGLLLPWLWLLAQIRRDPRLLSGHKTDRVMWVVSLMLFVLAYFYFPFRPGVADKADIAAMLELENLARSQADQHGKAVLVLDSAEGLAFPESLYLSGYRALYDRGALEEWSGAERQLPNGLLDDVKRGRFVRIFWRKGEKLGVTAYGVPYLQFYNVLQENYSSCTDVSLAQWIVLCQRNSKMDF